LHQFPHKNLILVNNLSTNINHVCAADRGGFLISREMLYALLQGLPEKYFAHMDAPWHFLARLINLELKAGRDPISALKAAFARTNDFSRQKIKETLLNVMPVMQIPRLSYRQREALIALRSVKSASLAQLCCILAQDRRNLYRRLNALVRKGLAIRFYQPGGVFYFATSAPMEKSLKLAVNQFLDELIKQYSAEPGPDANGSHASASFTSASPVAATTQPTQATFSP
jgi:predicted transcriptional regulator